MQSVAEAPVVKPIPDASSLSELSTPSVTTESGLTPEEALVLARKMAKDYGEHSPKAAEAFKNIDKATAAVEVDENGFNRVVVSIPATDTSPAVRLVEESSPELRSGSLVGNAKFDAYENQIVAKLEQTKVEPNAWRKHPAQDVSHEIEHYEGKLEYGAHLEDYRAQNPEIKDGKHFNDLSKNEQREIVLDHVLKNYPKSSYVAATIEAYDGKIDAEARQHLPGGDKYREAVLARHGVDQTTGEPSAKSKEWLHEVNGRYEAYSDTDMQLGIQQYTLYTSNSSGAAVNNWKNTPLANPPEVGKEEFADKVKRANLYYAIAAPISS